MRFILLGINLAIGVSLVGCVSSHEGAGRVERRMDSLKSYVQERHQSLTGGDLKDIRQIAYFVTHGVTEPGIPLLDPTIEKNELSSIDGIPPASSCIIVGMKGAWESNIACFCEAWIHYGGSVDFHTAVLAWDGEKKTWGILGSSGIP